MGTFSAVHWLVVIVVCLLVFGPKRLGEAGQGLGGAIKNFKKGLNDAEEEDAPRPRRVRSGKTR
jgi:sec-independent protein translocase protein TatA